MTIFQEEHLLFKQSIQKFSEKHILPYVDEWESSHYFPSSIFTTLGEQGFLGILIDEHWGGIGGDYTYGAAWCEAFGRIPAVGFTVAVNMHSLIITPTVQRYGSEEAKEQWLSRAVEGKAIGAYAFTEPGAGSDLSGIQTKAVKDGDDYLISGAKTFITNGKRADYVLVLAKTDPSLGYKGFTTFVVDTTLEGFSVPRTLNKLGWHSSDTAELHLDKVRVPQSMILGSLNEGWQQAMRSLEWERLMLALTSIGGAAQCLEDTVHYVNDRKVFGKSVGSYDYNRRLIIRMWSELESARALAYRCVELLNEGKKCRKEVSLCKRFACQLAIDIADRCVQLHGGYGYTTEFSPERWLRDLRLNTIGGGTNEIMNRVAAKELFV